MNIYRGLMIITSLLCIFTLSGCYAPDSDFESSSTSNYNTSKYESITKIAAYAKSQYDKGTIQLGYVINKERLDDLEKNDEINGIFDDENYCYYKLTMNDDNTVIIQKDVIFQSVVGYVATKNDALNTRKTEGIENPVMDVPSSLGYDSDLIVIAEYIGEIDEWNLYSYRAGM